MKLQVYILRQLLVSLAFAVGAVLLIALPGIAANTVQRLPNADAVVLLRYLPIVLQSLVPYVLPICFLLTVVSTYGRLAADREWTAIQMAGIQPLKMLAPAFGIAIVLSAGTYWMLAEEIPDLKRRQKDLLIQATSSSIANLAPGRTRLQIGDFYLKGAWRDRETGVFREAYIHRPAGEGDAPAPDIFAESADIRVAADVLYVDLTGLRVVDVEEGNLAELEQFTIEYPLRELVPEEGGVSRRPKYLKSSVLLERLAAGEVPRGRVRRYQFEVHYRVALAAAYMLFLGLGVPTGLILRRGTQLGALAVAAGYGLAYYALSIEGGKSLEAVESVPVWVAAWATTVVGLVVSLLMTRKALRR